MYAKGHSSSAVLILVKFGYFLIMLLLQCLYLLFFSINSIDYNSVHFKVVIALVIVKFVFLLDLGWVGHRFVFYSRIFNMKSNSYKYVSNNLKCRHQIFILHISLYNHGLL